MEQTGSHFRIYMKFDIREFFENLELTQQDLKLQSKPHMAPIFIHRNSLGEIEIKYEYDR